MARAERGPDDDLVSQASALADETTTDRIVKALAKGANLLSGPPGWVAMVQRRIDEATNREALEYLHALGRRLQEVEDRLGLDDDDTATAVLEIIEKASSAKQREKTEYWAALCARIATHEGAGTIERQRLIDALESVRPVHLRLLYVLSQSENPPGFGGGNVPAYLAFMLPGIPEDLIRLAWGDLIALSIVGPFPTGTAVTPPWQLANQAVSPWGRRFIAFVEADRPRT